jgi:hypothetical protein
MNRTRTKINWTFDRKAAGRKFGYKTKSFQAVKDLVATSLDYGPDATFAILIEVEGRAEAVVI